MNCSAFSILLLGLAAVGSGPKLLAQAAEQGSPQVEVASIKPSRPDATVRNSVVAFRPGRFEAISATLADILNAMRGYDGRVRGGPKWAQTDRYDIVAKLDGQMARAQWGEAVLALLKDRFKLEIHHEETTETVLALTAGKALSSLSAAKDDEPTKILDGTHKVEFQATSIFYLANYLHQILHTTVLDRTGLLGRYDFTLDLDRAAEELTGSSATGASFPDRVRFAAEALRFRLVPMKVALDSTVIDYAERPSEN